MAQLVDITKVAVAPQHFTARVRIANGGPLTTDQDLVGTTHVYNLLPDIVDHACLGDAGTTFKECMGSTELAHLLEHVAIELMARTGLSGDVTCGRTWEVTGEPRTYDVQLGCPDDVLVAAAVSSAAWILQWAYSGARDPKPDVDAIVEGIRSMTEHADEIAAREEEREEGRDADVERKTDVERDGAAPDGSHEAVRDGAPDAAPDDRTSGPAAPGDGNADTAAKRV